MSRTPTKLFADDVHGVMIPGTGRFVAEEFPDEMLEALTGFIALTAA